MPLLGVFVSTNTHYFRILTEWMPNGDVLRYARSNPEANRLRLVSFFAVIAIALLLIINVQLSEVMSGVAYLHELRVVHGDLKGVRQAPMIYFSPH